MTPRPIPNKHVTVYYEKVLLEISPTLFFLAKPLFKEALDAVLNKNAIFLPALAKIARGKKCVGYFNVINSIKIPKLKAIIDMNRHFFKSSSKFVPYLPANSNAPT